jgi:hypothetical protein
MRMLNRILVFLLVVGLTRATFAATTWNPSDTSANVTVSTLLGQSNLTATQNAGTAWYSIRGNSTGRHTGKYHIEYLVYNFAPATANVLVGFGNASALLSDYPGQDTNGVGFDAPDGTYQNGFVGHNGCPISGAYTGNTIRIGLDIDMDNDKVWCTLDGVTYYGNSGTNNPGTNQGGQAIGSTQDNANIMPMVGFAYASGNFASALIITGSFGHFAFPIPSGFSGWDAPGTDAGSNVVTAATWDPSNKNASVTLSGGNLISSTSFTGAGVMSTDTKYNGVKYFEILGGGLVSLGVGNPIIGSGVGSFMINNAYSIATSAAVQNNSIGFASGGACGSWGGSSVYIGIKVDFGGNTISCTLDGSSFASVSMSAVPNFGLLILSEGNNPGAPQTLNVGQSGFHWPIPAGAIAWDQYQARVGETLLLMGAGE